MKVDVMNFKDNFMIWKQIEKRNGVTYMRIKKRRKGVELK